jgi:hypothetical protein
MEELLLVAIGIVIGWNLPQPDWARDAQEKVLGFFRKGNRP